MFGNYRYFRYSQVFLNLRFYVFYPRLKFFLRLSMNSQNSQKQVLITTLRSNFCWGSFVQFFLCVPWNSFRFNGFGVIKLFIISHKNVFHSKNSKNSRIFKHSGEQKFYLKMLKLRQNLTVLLSCFFQVGLWFVDIRTFFQKFFQFLTILLTNHFYIFRRNINVSSPFPL